MPKWITIDPESVVTKIPTGTRVRLQYREEETGMFQKYRGGSLGGVVVDPPAHYKPETAANPQLVTVWYLDPTDDQADGNGYTTKSFRLDSGRFSRLMVLMD